MRALQASMQDSSARGLISRCLRLMTAKMGDASFLYASARQRERAALCHVVYASMSSYFVVPRLTSRAA